MYYNEEFKRNVVNRYIAGDSATTIHKDTGVSRSTIYEWINSSKESFSIMYHRISMKKGILISK